jgi:hypothetical protein
MGIDGVHKVSYTIGDFVGKLTGESKCESLAQHRFSTNNIDGL